jgi:DNA-binding GntR family transcriptional regulator
LELGVSRTPVKEAIERLHAEKLVSLESHRGAFVVSIGRDEIREVFEVREALELRACDLYAHGMDSKALARLKEINDRLAVSDAPPSVQQQFVDNREFHGALVRLTGNALLTELHAIVMRRLQMAFVDPASDTWTLRAQNDHQEHQAVLQALAENRIDDAKKALREHLRLGMKRSLEDFAAVTAKQSRQDSSHPLEPVRETLSSLDPA